MLTHSQTGDQTVTAKEALRNWKDVTDRALREPVVVTSHNKPRHVIMAYDHYVALRDKERQALKTGDLTADLKAALLRGVTELRSPSEAMTDGDPIIE